MWSALVTSRIGESKGRVHHRGAEGTEKRRGREGLPPSCCSCLELHTGLERNDSVRPGTETVRELAGETPALRRVHVHGKHTEIPRRGFIKIGRYNGVDALGVRR